MKSNLYSAVTWMQFYEYIKPYFNEIPKTIDGYFDMARKNENDIIGHSMKEWGNMEDVYLLNLLSDLQFFKGELLVVTEVSWYSKWSPFKVSSENIIRFVEDHIKNFNECFFNGDVVIISLESKSMWIFHHEGMYTLVKYI